MGLIRMLSRSGFTWKKLNKKFTFEQKSDFSFHFIANKNSNKNILFLINFLKFKINRKITF